MPGRWPFKQLSPAGYRLGSDRYRIRAGSYSARKAGNWVHWNLL